MSLRNNFSIVWRFLNAFQLRGRVGVNKSISKNEMFKSPSHPDFLSETRKGTYSREDDDNFSYNGDLTLTYGKIFRDVHLVNLVGGWTLTAIYIKIHSFPPVSTKVINLFTAIRSAVLPVFI